MLDTPRPGSNVPECLSEHLTDAGACMPAADEVSREPDRRALVADVARAEGVTVVDPMPWFCTDQWCPVIVGNVLVYRDTNHISVPYATLLAPLLADALEAADRT